MGGTVKTVDELVAFSAQIEGQGIEDHQNCTYTRPELAALAAALLKLPERACTVEIGVYAGRSASLSLQLQPDRQLDIHLIDNWAWRAEIATQTFSRLIIDHFIEVPFTLHRMRSDYLGPQWNLPIDFLHVDGWHDMPGVEPDCQLWLPWVRPGGIVAFHDSFDPAVAICIEKYVKETGWTLIGEAGRTTAWEKPHA